MSHLVIVHFSPLELYPPIQNLLNILGAGTRQKNIVVLTRHKELDALKIFSATCENIKIVRICDYFRGARFFRLFNYLFFYAISFCHLVRICPKSILYFESISSFPVSIYKWFWNRRVNVFVHYHEYTSPEEYMKGMAIVRWAHTLERLLYPRTKWVSHTNALRLAHFQNDIAPVKIPNAQVLPNYPPRSWARRSVQTEELPLKIVYAGALSLKTMYTEKFADWVLSQQGNVIWDIYSYNCTDDAAAYVKDLNTPWINLKGGVDYLQLPVFLSNYSVGVILYKGHIPNYVYNAPNKLFEYLACNLTVWYPDVMIGCQPYTIRDSSPQVLPVDFSSLETLLLEDIQQTAKLNYKQPQFNCETASKELIHQLLNDK